MQIKGHDPEFTSIKKGQEIVCKENKCKYVAINKFGDKIVKHKIDGHIFKDNITERCDFLLINCNQYNAYLIELKGTKFNKGISQLKTTYELLKPELKNYKIHFRLIVTGFNTHKISSSEILELKKLYRFKHKSTEMHEDI
ncbi:MAG: hypothetical protein FWE37_09375 [Spirochaetaceae bacterium]|nr:hypothetical protein [Spirochaetaceae bacterium]